MLVLLWISHENNFSRRLVVRDGFAVNPDFGSIFFGTIRWEAAPSADFAKVDFAKSGFQRT